VSGLENKHIEESVSDDTVSDSKRSLKVRPEVARVRLTDGKLRN